LIDGGRMFTHPMLWINPETAANKATELVKLDVYVYSNTLTDFKMIKHHFNRTVTTLRQIFTSKE
jgi:hypothetical protein